MKTKLIAIICAVVAVAATATIVGVSVANKDKPQDSSSISSSSSVQKVTYSVTWLDENGNVLLEESVEEGKTPSYSYAVTDTAEWDYTFEGWASSQDGEVIAQIPVASQDVSYYAIVSAVKQKYTITFNSNGGSAVESQTVEYGSKVTIPEVPTYEGHRFVNWSYDIEGTNTVDFDNVVTGNDEYFAIWNEVVNVKALLSTLLNGYELNPFQYIPSSMLVDYSANLVDANDIISDYSNFVNISDVTYGFGEQWHMVLDNLAQSQVFFNVLSVVDTISTSSITIFNNYFDKNPSDTANYNFADGIYNVTIDFDGEIISYVLDYTANLPIFGEQTIQIALSMIVETGEKIARLQIGDANALKYTMLENSYDFAIRYLGVRRAMFSIEQNDNGVVVGHIYEYLTVSEVEVVSAADFCITEDYVSVVGNKASGLLGFSNYISEVYNVNTGKLIGYEVMETQELLGFEVTFNTLWFNLNDINGITSVKYQEADEDTPAKLFVNGSSTQWETKKFGGVTPKTQSRRFDIEFRTQYVYSYDAANQAYVQHTVQVPMIFVQEEVYDEFVADVKAINNVTISVEVSDDDLQKVLDDYDQLVPIFIENKEVMTPDVILAYIGEKIVF